MFDTPNWSVNPTALRARIDDVTRPKPMASVTWFNGQPLSAVPGITCVGFIAFAAGSKTS
jgi:hypothetical protein